MKGGADALAWALVVLALVVLAAYLWLTVEPRLDRLEDAVWPAPTATPAYIGEPWCAPSGEEC
jgi:hypothetical protein